MKRTNLLTTATLAAIAVVMAAAFVGAVNRQQQHDPTKPCLNGCGKDQKPPGCCEEPECGILQEYAIQEALDWSLSPPDVPTSWIPASAKNIGASQADSYVQALYSKARSDVDQAANKSANCPGYSPPRTHLQLNDECAIGSYTGTTFTPMSREDARTNLNMGDCPEIRDAEYDAAEERQTQCEIEKIHRQNAVNPVFYIPTMFSRDDLIAEARSQSEKRLESLRNSMLRFWQSCQQFGNQQLLQQIEDALAPPLQQKMPSKPPQKKAKRASGGRGGGRGGRTP
jgi:hypothetical protein